MGNDGGIGRLAYDRESLMKYLNNPTKEGIWHLTATIKDDKAFLEDLRKRDATFKDSPPIFSIIFGEWLVDMGYLLTEKENPDNLLLKRAGLTPDEDSTWRRRMRGAPQVFTKPPKKIRRDKREAKQTKYKDEIKTLSTSFPQLNPVISHEGFDFLSLSQPQHFSIPFPRARTHLEAVSVAKESMEELSKIIDAFVKNSSSVECSLRLRKVYTPEHFVYMPYTYVLFLANRKYNLTDNHSLAREIDSVLMEVFEGKIDGAVRCCGLAMEILLVEVFESCFRKKTPHKPLGEIFDNIEKCSREILGERTEVLKSNLTTDFTSVNALISKEGTSDIGVCAAVCRKLLHRDNEILDRLNKIEGKLQMGRRGEHPLFAPSLVESIVNSIEIRNSGTHRRSGDLSQFHVASCLRGIVNLVSWWEHERALIRDWNDPIDVVLKRIAETGPKFDV